MFKAGMIDATEFESELDTLNLKAAYRNKILATTVLEKKAAGTLPSKTDVLGWYKKGTIDQAEFIRRMGLLGYSEADAQLYLTYTPPQPGV